MPIPAVIGRFNRTVTNHVTRPLAPGLPGFGVVHHNGKKTGRAYATPVNVFPRRGGFVFALTYGPDAQWVHNVLARGGCTLQTRGRTWTLTNPRRFRDERHRQVPLPVRLILRLTDVNEFLDLSISVSRPR